MKLSSVVLVLLLFFSSLTCFSQELVSIGLSKMNVLYRGVDNPATVAVSGVSQKDLKVTIDNGTIKKDGNSYIISPVKLGTAVMTIYVKEKVAEKAEFRVKDLPDPVARVNGQKGGAIDLDNLIKSGGLTADLDNCDFQYPFKVVEFTMTYNKDGFTQSVTTKSDKFSTEQITRIKTLKQDQKLYFEDIKVMGPEGAIRTLGSIIFKIK